MALIAIKHKSRRMLKPALWALVIIFVGSVFVGYGGYNFSQAEEELAIARVGGRELAGTDYVNELKQLREQMRNFAGGGLDMQFFIARQAYENLVDEHLKARAAEGMGLSVSEREARAQRDAELRQQLEGVGAGLSKDDLDQQLSLLQGLPQNAPANWRRRMLAERLDEKLREKARPVELRVSQIVVKADKRSRTQALELAQKLYREAAAPGADFAALAKAKSEDAATKEKGGDTGWLNIETPRMGPAGTPPEVISTAYQLKKGQVSQPVPTEQGYALVKVTEERPFASDTKDEEQKKQEIESFKQRVAQAIVQGQHSILKLEAEVEPVSPFVAGLLAEQQAEKLMQGSQGSVAPGAAPAKQELSAEAKTKLQEAVTNYEKAAGTVGLEIGPAYAYHMGQLYSQLGEYDKAEKAFNQVLTKMNASEVRMALGDVMEKAGKKKEAIEQYQEASKVAYDRPYLHGQLATKFKELKRPDLAKEEEKLNQKYLKEQEEQRKAQAEAQKKMMEAQAKAAAEAKKAEAAAKKAPEAAKQPAAPAAGGPAATTLPVTQPAPLPAPAGNAPAAP